MNMFDSKEIFSGIDKSSRILGFVFGSLTLLLYANVLFAEDETKQLQEKGVTIAEIKGGGTSVAIKDCAKLAEADFRAIGKMAHVKTLSFGLGLNEASLALMSELTELESISTNGMQISDDGLKPLSQMKKLKSVTFFHPGPLFSGAGLVHLADLPSLEQLTVAGSDKFVDAGMNAVGKLTQLKGFRTWHAGYSAEGLRSLKTLKALKSLVLGQRLSGKPPASLTDDAISTLTEMTALESVQLGEARLSLAALSQLKQLPALKKLALDGIDLPKSDIELLKAALPKTDIKYTEPNEGATKRINQLFGA